jgi:hypothetical protein
MKLLEGAVAMNEHFKTAPYAENVVLQYVAVNHSVGQAPRQDDSRDERVDQGTRSRRVVVRPIAGRIQRQRRARV